MGVTCQTPETLPRQYATQEAHDHGRGVFLLACSCKSGGVVKLASRGEGARGSPLPALGVGVWPQRVGCLSGIVHGSIIVTGLRVNVLGTYAQAPTGGDGCKLSLGGL